MSKRKKVTCHGWNFHVYTLGADRCSVCKQPRHHDEEGASDG